MFAFFETRPCSWGLIFSVSSDFVKYLYTGIMFAGIHVCDLKTVAKFAK